MKKTIIAIILIIICVGLTRILLRSEVHGSWSTFKANPGDRNINSKNPGSATERSPRGRTSNRSGDYLEEFKREFGESRTNLSKKVSENILKTVVDMIEMDGSMIPLAGEGDPRSLINRIDRLSGFSASDLDEAQKRKLVACVEAAMQRKAEQRKEFAKAVQSDPSELMKYLLIDDAAARETITSEEANERIDSLKLPVDEVLDGLDFTNGANQGIPRNDPQLDKEVAGILHPDQYKKWRDRNVEIVPGEIGTSEDGIASGNSSSEPAEGVELELIMRDHQNLEAAEKKFAATQMMVSGLKDLQKSFGVILETK